MTSAIDRDRPAKNPGGMQCERCDEIFIGDEWHAFCGICIQQIAGDIAAEQNLDTRSPQEAEVARQDD